MGTIIQFVMAFLQTEGHFEKRPLVFIFALFRGQKVQSLRGPERIFLVLLSQSSQPREAPSIAWLTCRLLAVCPQAGSGGVGVGWGPGPL